MDSNSPKPESDRQHPRAPELESAPGLSRRRLLRSVAHSAPLIATLPSGAALANASAVQCAIFQQREAELGRPNGVAGADGYVRVEANTWTQFIFPNTVTLYEFRALDNSETVTVDAAGNRFALSAPPGASVVQLLVLYQPIGDPLTDVDTTPSVTGDPTYPNPRPAQCTYKSGLTGWTGGAPYNAGGVYCVFPVAELGPSPDGNIGLTPSCLNSFA